MLVVDIFGIRALDKWQPAQHPRAKSGAKAGQFVKKGAGEEGGGKKSPPRIEKGIPLVGYSQPAPPLYKLHQLATSKQAEADPKAAAAAIHAHMAQHKWKYVQSYGKAVLKALAAKHGLPKEALLTPSAAAAAPEPKAKAAPAPKPAEAPKQEPKSEPTPKETPKPKEPEPKPEPEPTFPAPHAGSEYQQNLHKIATSAKPKAEKIAELKAAAAPGPYSTQYKSQLLAALGEQPAAPAAAPAPGVTQPTKPSASWQAGMKVLQGGVRSTSSLWDAQKARKVMPTAAAGYWDGVPSEQRAACKEYVGSSTAINNALRDPEHVPEYLGDTIRAIDEAFEAPEARTKDDMVVYRGMPLNVGGKPTIPLEKLKKALKAGLPASLHWDGFVSTSFANEAAFSNHAVQVEIGVPKGQPALAFGGSIGLPSENEVLLPHGRAFQVLSIEETQYGGKKHYKMRVVMK
jgi:hypothetical protein